MPEMKEVNSSNIYSVGHDPASKTLHVTFRSSKDKRMPSNSFTYANVTADQHQEMLDSPSVGSYFSQHIKGRPERHPATKKG